MENNGILKSFDLQDELNSKIWIKVKGDNYVISQKVREKLLEIAYEFIEFLNVDIIVSDVHLTGSLANYNWSQYSDFDLHIIADFEQFPKNKLELYKELLTLKKTIFNSDQNIKIYGYDVELYVQDENEEHTSSGVYSLISNEWIETPKKEKFEVNKSVLKKKIDQWTEKIDKILESAEEEKDLQKSKKIIDNLKTKLKEYRKIGLEKGGEMSYENLVFKYLRRSGHIEKLFSFKKERLDKGLSLKEQEEKNKLFKFFQKIFGKKNKEEKTDDPKKADLVGPDVEEFYKNLESIKEPVSQQKKGEMNFQKNVETIQIGLSLLGYELPRFGVDGLYGPETGAAVEKFKIENLGEEKGGEVSSDKKSKVMPPVSMSRIISGFGPRGGKIHSGVDIGVVSGTQIKSPADGEVIDADFKPGSCGGTIAVKHGDNLKTRYCHCKQINVSKGDIIKQGDVIGLTGGDFSDKGKGNSQGPHLHLEVYTNGVPVDPLSVIDKKYIGSLTGTVDSTTTPEMIEVMIDKLKSKGVKSEDLKKYLDAVKMNSGDYIINSLDVSPNAIPSDSDSMTKIVIDNFEGGYYNPEWHYHPAMGRSGETMFGMDRVYGSGLFKSGEGREFWQIIDNNKSKDVWKHYYMGGNLKNELSNLVSKIMEKSYNENSNKYLTKESRKLVNSNNGLKFHFWYACWNGPGYFQKFANIINKAVSDGIDSPKELLSIAINSRLNSGAIKKSGEKMLKIFKG